jgi:signal recognition particle receptor subunit beta
MMAVLDPRDGTVVIRVVYDGAPMAGKSTSVAALGRGFGSKVYSPAQVNGRTLYFDWLEYTGGQFDGRRIRCQILSVPGQATLAPRRRHMLESADAVVFVADSSPAGFISDRGSLSGLARMLEQVPGPPVGLVLQANKRDHSHAIPLDQIRSMMESIGMRAGIIESVANQGVGIREAFVFAVRLALDRVRELMRTQLLLQARPQFDSPQELLDLLRKSEEGGRKYTRETGLAHTRVTDVLPESIVAEAIAQATLESEPVAKGHVPATPDERVASGLVWPPVDGRTVLHEIAKARIQLSCSEQGDWSGVSEGQWQIYSAASDVFDDVNAGRMVLVEAARNNAAADRGRSIDKCVALASDGSGRYRLWHITRPAEAASRVEKWRGKSMG